MTEEVDFAELDVLLDRLASAHRRGEQLELPPDVAANPALAQRVRQLLNTMIHMEGLATPFPEVRKSKKRFHTHVEQVGEYQIIREIGRGGMGVVYEAEQPKLRRRVALKVLPDFAIGDPVAVERFQREARAAARLHHTNIVPVFEIGRDGERRFFAMQLINGCGLDQLIHLRKTRSSRIEETPLPSTAAIGDKKPGDDAQFKGRTNGKTHLFPGPNSPWSPEVLSDSAVNRTAQISIEPEWIGCKGKEYFRAVAKAGARAASALNHAHSRGVIHRDIKPSNLLVDESGVLWVTDFGLAKTDDEDITRPNAVLGTARYMAPERFQGQGDTRSDIYSLGVTLYEVAALRPAFKQLDHVELIAAITKTEPPKLRTVDPSIPRDFETVILKAIEKDPQRRYQTAADFQADLERFANDEPVVARRQSLPSRFSRFCRKNPVVSGLAAAVAILLIGFAGYFVVSARRLSNELDRVAKLQVAETTAKIEATLRLQEAHIERARAIRRSPQIGRRFESLKAIQSAADIGPDPRLRDEAIAGLAHFDLSPELAAFDMKEPGVRNTFGSGFTDALDQYAVANSAGIQIVRVAGRKKIMQLPHATKDRFYSVWCHFSPDRRFLAVGYRLYASSLFIASIFNLEKRAITFYEREVEFAWASDGQLLVWDRSPGTMRLVEPQSGKASWTAPWNLPKGCVPRLSSDRKTVAVWRASSPTVSIHDFATGTLQTQFEHATSPMTVEWSPDGRLLAVCLRNFECAIWDVARQHRQTTLLGHSFVPERISFHPSGTMVATTATDQATKFWNPRDGQLLLSLPASIERFSADGTKLAARVDTTASIWNVAASDVQRRLDIEALTNDFIRYPVLQARVDFSPDGRLLACNQLGGVRIFEVPGLREIGSIACGPVSAVSFDSKTENLYTLNRNNSHRWPIRKRTSPDAVTFLFGPPEPMRPGGGNLERTVVGADRATMAVPLQPTRDVALINVNHPWDRKLIGPTQRIVNVALSHNGRWLAAGGYRSNRIHVWDIQTGVEVALLDCDPDRTGEVGAIAFRPDDRYLLTQDRTVIFWDTSTWRAATNIPRIATRYYDVAPVFSARADLLAIAISPEEIRLYEASTMTKLASLTPSDACELQSMVFDPSGDFLATVSLDQKLYVWNLAALRQSLAGIGLNWMSNASPTNTSQSEEPVSPSAARSAGNHVDGDKLDVRIEAVGTDLWKSANYAWWTLARTYAASLGNGQAAAAAHFQRAESYRVLNRRQDEFDELNAAIAANPRHADAVYARGYWFTTNQQTSRSLPDLKAALELRPNWRDALDLRGRVYARLQRWPEAAADFERICVANPADCTCRIWRDTAWIYSGKIAEAAADLTKVYPEYWNDTNFFGLWLRALARTGNDQEIEHAIAATKGLGKVVGEDEDTIAFALLCGPEGARRPERALQIIEAGIKVQPNYYAFLNTLALAQFRLNRVADAMATIERRLTLAKHPATAFDAAVQALCNLQLGNPDLARQNVRYSKAWRDRNMRGRPAYEVADLNLLLAEAEKKIQAAANR